MKILVTGAMGQLGTWMRLLTGEDENYIYSDVLPSEGIVTLDITNKYEVEGFIRANGIGLVVNCAAYTNVEKAEDEVETCYLINSDGTANLARAMAATGGGRLIHISTDYVFDGKSDSHPLKEDDVVNPLSIYGKSKLEAEKRIIESGCNYLILRTAWLYSEFGRNFLKTMSSLMESGKDIKVVDDQWGSPTYARDLAEAILGIISSGKYLDNCGIWHFTDEGETTWFGFAREIASVGGYGNCNVHPCSTEDYPTKAARPAYSVLDKNKFKKTFSAEIPHWKDSLKRCMENIRERKI